MDAATAEVVKDCLLIVIILAVIPWRYVYTQFVAKPGSLADELMLGSFTFRLIVGPISASRPRYRLRRFAWRRGGRGVWPARGGGCRGAR